MEDKTFRMPQIRYQPVPIEASHECPCAQSKHKSSLDLKSFSIGTILGIVASCITFALVLYTENRPDRCTRKLSAWSPALSIYSDADFYTTYFDSSAKDPKLLGNKVLPVNEFRGPPSSAIDDAWDKVINPNESLIRLSKDELERSHGPEYAAEYTQELGGGYIATVEIYHYLHCLNMIRKATYMDHYLPRMQEWQDNPLLTRYHIGMARSRHHRDRTDNIADHCIDNIRQKVRVLSGSIWARLTQVASSCAIPISA